MGLSIRRLYFVICKLQIIVTLGGQRLHSYNFYLFVFHTFLVYLAVQLWSWKSCEQLSDLLLPSIFWHFPYISHELSWHRSLAGLHSADPSLDELTRLIHPGQAPLGWPQSRQAKLGRPQSKRALLRWLQSRRALLRWPQSRWAPLGWPQSRQAPLDWPQSRQAPLGWPQSRWAPLGWPQFVQALLGLIAK